MLLIIHTSSWGSHTHTKVLTIVHVTQDTVSCNYQAVIMLILQHHILPVYIKFSCYTYLASFPGPSQILSHSRGEKSGEGLGSKLRHGPEMVDSVSTNRVRITY